jgi:hypothetical protein
MVTNMFGIVALLLVAHAAATVANSAEQTAAPSQFAYLQPNWPARPLSIEEFSAVCERFYVAFSGDSSNC